MKTTYDLLMEVDNYIRRKELYKLYSDKGNMFKNNFGDEEFHKT